MVTIICFWSVGVCGEEMFGRHDLDSFCDLSAFKILWKHREEIDASFYNINSISCDGPMLNCIDFEEDYNNEMLDGGKWCRVMHLLEYDVEKNCEKE